MSELSKQEALQDSAYIAGAKAGWNLGVNEDNEGFAKLIESRNGYLASLRSPTPSAGAVSELADFIIEGWDNQDISHVDFRVGAYKAALDAKTRLASGMPSREIIAKAIEVVSNVCVLESLPADDDYERTMHEIGNEIVRRLRSLSLSPAAVTSPERGDRA